MSTTASSSALAASTAYEVYDFRRPPSLAREFARVLEPAIESFARLWATQFSAQLRVPVSMRLEQLQAVTYDEVSAATSVSRIVAVLSADGVRAKPTLSMPFETGMLLVSRLLGGVGDFTPPGRPITDIESLILTQAVAGLARDLEYGLGELLTAIFNVDSIAYGALPVHAAAPTDGMISMTMALQIADHVADVIIALPPECLQLDVRVGTSDRRSEDVAGALRRQLGEVPVEVSLRLSDVAIDPERLLRLEVGEIIGLPHEESRPLLLTVDGQVFATAATGRSGSRLACRIVTTTEEDPR
jgi:flagellar motor switch protein FliM